MPLVGAGARGFPVDVAIHVAAQVCADCMLEHTATTNDKDSKKKDNSPHTDHVGTITNTMVVFGLLEPAHAKQLVAALTGRLESQPHEEE